MNMFTEKKFNLEDQLGFIVEVFPGAGDYFMGWQIDFCCGGARTLAEGIKEKNVDAEQVLEGLNSKYAEFLDRKEIYLDWAKEDRMKLVEHILNTHHQYLKQELPVLSSLVFKILSVHGTHHPMLFQLHKNYNLLRLELEEHLVKEEDWLFPGVRAYEKSRSEEERKNLLNLIQTLEEEHTGAGDLIKSMRELTDHYQLPKGACTTFALVYEKLRALEKDTFEHIHLENNILFKYL